MKNVRMTYLNHGRNENIQINNNWFYLFIYLFSTNPTGWWMSEKLDGVRAYWDGTYVIVNSKGAVSNIRS